MPLTVRKLMYISLLRHGRMHEWLNSDLTRGAAMKEGRAGVGLRNFVLVSDKGVTALGRK